MACAEGDVPPDFAVLFLFRRREFRIVGIDFGAPDVDERQVRREAAGGHHVFEGARRRQLDLREELVDVRVVLRLGLVKHIGIEILQPAFGGKMFLEFVRPDGIGLADWRDVRRNALRESGFKLFIEFRPVEDGWIVRLLPCFELPCRPTLKPSVSECDGMT